MKNRQQKIMMTTEEIQSFAVNNGIHAVGWFTAVDFDEYLATINERVEYHNIVYKPLDAFQKAAHIPEEIQTVIVLLMDYFVESSDLDGYRLSNYVRACWATLSPKTMMMKKFLTDKGYCAESLELPQRAAACRAGLGFIGRNTMFYSNNLGSYVGVASIGTNATLEEIAPAQERVSNPQCKKCNRCVSACPVAAILTAGYQIDPLRCLSMLNRHPDEPKRKMPQNRDKLDNWIYGCEICQNVCPHNAKVKHKNDAVVGSEIIIENMHIQNMVTLPKERLISALDSCASNGYREYIFKMLGNYGTK